MIEISEPEIDEISLISRYFKSYNSSLREPLVMIDVGAHVGSTSIPFARSGWQVYSFEPEPYNFSRLKQNVGQIANVTIVHKAVTESGDQVTLFKSSDHWGIHSIKPFHATHSEEHVVDSVRLDEFIENHGIAWVNLLKVDTEGGDFGVIKSLNFEHTSPQIVMVEFMDSRSKPHFGYGYRDMIAFMEQKGYQAYVFSYSPIQEYGREGQVTHSSRLLNISSYQPQMDDPDWGNIIFCKKDDSGFEELLQAEKVAQNRRSRVRKSAENIKRFKNIHKGKRCVIIGNGPSLNAMDLSFLEHEFCIGLNKIYLIFDQWDFRPSYFTSVNPLVLKQNHQEILNEIECPKFVSVAGLEYFEEDRPDLLFMPPDRFHTFSPDLSEGMCEGYTVTFVAMQIAYYMGFEDVVLIGVDHSFSTKGDPNKKVVSGGDDPNHFHPDYFGEGVEWHLPDLDNSERFYRMAKEIYEMDGRVIRDATVGGKLDIFEKVNYTSHFNGEGLSVSSGEPTSKAVGLERARTHLSNQKVLEGLNIVRYLIKERSLSFEEAVGFARSILESGLPGINKQLLNLLFHYYGNRDELRRLTSQTNRSTSSRLGEAISGIQQLLEMGKLDQADELIGKLSAVVGNNSDLQMLRVQLRLRKNEVTEAREILGAIIENFPNYKPAKQLQDKINSIY